MHVHISRMGGSWEREGVGEGAVGDDLGRGLGGVWEGSWEGV